MTCSGGQTTDGWLRLKQEEKLGVNDVVDFVFSLFVDYQCESGLVLVYLTETMKPYTNVIARPITGLLITLEQDIGILLRALLHGKPVFMII